MKMMIVMALAISLAACKNTGTENRGSEMNDTTKSPVLDTSAISQLSPERRDTLSLYQERRDKTRVAVEEIRTGSGNKEVKDKLQARSEELDEKLDVLDDKIDQLRKSSETAWNKTKMEIDSLLTDLDQTIDKAKDNLKN